MTLWDGLIIESCFDIDTDQRQDTLASCIEDMLTKT